MPDLKLYRVEIILKGPLGTPLTSGTLFGQLCWMMREADGEQALVTWLAARDSLWAISDGFPSDLLPRPLLAPVVASERMEDADNFKKQKKKEFVTREGFLQKRGNLTPASISEHLRGAEKHPFRTAHNTIDRNTGSTPESGGLYFLEEDWSFSRRAGDGAGSASPGRDVYVRAPAGLGAKIRNLFQALGQSGFGRDATLGRGMWSVAKVDEDIHLGAAPVPQKGARVTLRQVSLSHGAAEGFGDMRCKLMAHYGKAGPMVTVGEGASPFKRPLLLTRPGATFATANALRPGAIITGVHAMRPEIIHNGLHVTVGYCEAQP